tara:strand:- start:1098 stop:1862 length:765 start_codon:yes stop_codon:yes gene_type:complete
MNNKFMGKNILIIGSNGLVGKSLVSYLNKRGHNVFKIDIKQKKKEKNFFKCDVTKESSVAKIIKKITKKTSIDVVFNAASVNPKTQKIKKFKFSDYNLNKWKNNLEVDLIGSFNISKHILKHYEKKNSGKIINISSIYGFLGPDQDIYFNQSREKYTGMKPLEYSVAKAGVIGFTKALASFYKNSKIEVFCLVLGGIEEGQDTFFKKKYSKKTISGRMALKGEYNTIIDFLITNNTSYLTGSSIDLSAGALSIL